MTRQIAFWLFRCTSLLSEAFHARRVVNPGERRRQAWRGDEIFTSDPADLHALAQAAGIHIEFIPVRPSWGPAWPHARPAAGRTRALGLPRPAGDEASDTARWLHSLSNI